MGTETKQSTIDENVTRTVYIMVDTEGNWNVGRNPHEASEGLGGEVNMSTVRIPDIPSVCIPPRESEVLHDGWDYLDDIKF